MDELIYLDPRNVFDEMIIGVASRPYAIVYDLDAMISYWSKEFQDCDTDEERASEMAWEWYDYNVLGSYLGENTPYMSLSHPSTTLKTASKSSRNESTSRPL